MFWHFLSQEFRVYNHYEITDILFYKMPVQMQILLLLSMFIWLKHIKWINNCINIPSVYEMKRIKEKKQDIFQTNKTAVISCCSC